MKSIQSLLNLTFLLSIFSINTSRAQPPSIAWDQSYGSTFHDIGYAVQQTNDGGYIFAGSTGSIALNGMPDFYIIKTDADGDVEWERTLGGSEWDEAFAIQQTFDGGYIVAGYTFSNDGDVDGSHGYYDAWVIKLTAAGNVTWKRTYGGTQSEFAHDIQQTPDGGYIFAGYSNSNNGDVSDNNGLSDYWLVRLDAGGNILWENSFGGSLEEQAFGLDQTTDGGFIITGFANSNDGDVTGFHGIADIWIVKTDAAGNLQWQKSYGGSQFENALGIVQTTDGGYVIGGGSYSNDGDVSANAGREDAWILKITSTGDITWEESYGGKYTEAALSIIQTSDGGYAFTGFNTGKYVKQTDQEYYNAWVVKLDASGQMTWQKEMGSDGSDLGFSLQQTADNGYIMGGTIKTTAGGGSGYNVFSDAWLVKLEPGGNGGGGGNNPCSGHKVLICHNGHEICVDTHAIPAHLAHGDYLGECIEEIAFPGNPFGHDLEEAFNINPNPSTGDFVVTTSHTPGRNAILQIVDATGKIIQEVNMSSTFVNDFTLNENGIYFIRLISDAHLFTKKIIVAR